MKHSQKHFRHGPRGAWKLSVLVVLVALLRQSAALAAEAQFFRLSTASETKILQMTADGIMVWSNAALGGNYLIETTEDSRIAEWRPLVRGFVTNDLTSVRVKDFDPPEGMVFIPAGYFTMGETEVSLPQHTAIISPFYIGRHEVTAGQMRDVMQWAYDNGKVTVVSNYVVNVLGEPQPLLYFGILDSLHVFNAGSFSVLSGRTNHPCVAVTWYGSVAYCNFLSEMKGMELCYSFTNWSCDFGKQGFRLPTEAEWEKAARGGIEQQRFPWGETITHAEANYKSDTVNWYDVSPTRGFHPVYDALYRPLRTAPVGSFTPNGYGLYDMAGNAWEWTWDVSGTYTSATVTDPTGPARNAIPTNRIFKGGSWMTGAERVASFSHYIAARATMRNGDIGFRTALRSPP
jgi:formylglycine-generating enzyme required for sulfatase activity